MKSNVLKALFPILLAFIALPISAQSEIFVSPTGKANGDGSVQHPFNRIQVALEKPGQKRRDRYLPARREIYTRQTHRFHTPGRERYPAVICKSLSRRTGSSFRRNTTIPAMDTLQKGIMKAKVSGNPVMDILVVDGQLRHMARYPNFDEKAVRFNGTSAQATAPERVKKWKIRPEVIYTPCTGMTGAISITSSPEK